MSVFFHTPEFNLEPLLLGFHDTLIEFFFMSLIKLCSSYCVLLLILYNCSHVGCIFSSFLHLSLWHVTENSESKHLLTSTRICKSCILQKAVS